MADVDLLAQLGTPDEDAIAAGLQRSGADRARSDILTLFSSLAPDNPLQLLRPRLSSWLRRVRARELAAPLAQRLRLESSQALWALVARVHIAPGVWWYQDSSGRLSVWATENQRRALDLPKSHYRALRTHGRDLAPRAISFPVEDVRRVAREASGLLPSGLFEREAWRLAEGLRAITSLIVRTHPVEVRTSSLEAPVMRGLIDRAKHRGLETTYCPHAPLTIYPESTDIPHRRTQTTFIEDIPRLKCLGISVEPCARDRLDSRKPSELTPSRIVSISPWGNEYIRRFLSHVFMLHEGNPRAIALSLHPRISLAQTARLRMSGLRILAEPLDNHLASRSVQNLITWSSTAARTALLHGTSVTSVALWPWRHYRFEYSGLIDSPG